MSIQNTKQNKWRSLSTSAALGSVRAEGLRPSQATQTRLKQYATGKITASQLRRETLKDVRARHK